MLALAMGFLGAVIVLGAFCGGVFLGCWLCGEEGTPARAVWGKNRRRGRPWNRHRRRKRRPVYDGWPEAEEAPDADQSPYPAANRTAYQSADQTVNRTVTTDADRTADQTADQTEKQREAERERQRLREEQAAFRALQHYSAECAYGLGGQAGGAHGSFRLDGEGE